MAASRALRLGFALSLTGTGYVDLSLLHVPGNLRVTFVYARVLHHLCSIKCPVISEVVSESGSCCFDCAAMLGLTQSNSLVGSAPMQKYYAQIDWSTPQPQNSRTIGALMAMKALNDGKVWDADQNGECHVCDNEEDDDESPMLMCSFCNVGIHNSKECLGSVGSVISARDASNEDAEWACPMCWAAALKMAKGETSRVAGRKRPAPRGSDRGGGGRSGGGRGRACGRRGGGRGRG